MDPRAGGSRGELLDARTVVRIHFDGFEVEPWYRPISDAAERFTAAAARRSYATRVLELGEGFDVAAVPTPGAPS